MKEINNIKTENQNEEMLLKKLEDFADSLIKYNRINGGMMSDTLKTALIDKTINALTIINMSCTYIEEEE